MTFRRRVFFALLALVVLVEGVTFFAVLSTTRSDFVRRGLEQLEVGRRVFDDALARRGRELATAVQVLAADFGFKRAAVSADVPTIRSALGNHGARIGADFAILVDSAGSIVAGVGSARLDAPGVSFPWPALLRRGPSLEQATARDIVALENAAAQLVVTPVLAPQLAGWVAIGFSIDDAFAADIEALTHLSVSFVDRDGEDLRVSASTLADADRQALRNGLADAPQAFEPRPMALASGEFLSVRHRIVRQSAKVSDVVLAVPMDRVLDAYRDLRSQLVAILLLALLLSGVIARIIAGTVSEPLAKLAGAARRISRGRYTEAVRIGGTAELDALSTAFNQMQTGIQQREARIVYQSQHDALTGLPNRALLADRLEQSIRRATRNNGSFSLLMLDLDGFKGINDTLGHAVGDSVLQGIAERLKSAGRESDTVARLGGDEFMLLLEGTPLDDAVAVAGRLIDSCDAPVAIDSLEIAVDLCVGLVCFPAHGATAEELMRRADIAMYTAKDSDEQFLAIYQPGQDEEHLRRLSLASDLRTAIEQSGLDVHYQPKLDLRTGRLSAAEALVRWQHPVHGQLPPDEFIPIAEQAGYIRSLTRHVLEKVLSQLNRWHAEGLDLVASVNLSALDLLDESLPQAVEGLLARYRLDASCLILEITESAVMKDAAYARGVMQSLRALGVRLSIDDFGTGHSSLAQLKRMPVDELKIDKSFVLDLATNADDAVIVRSTIELAHNMGLSVTAEGVETPESREMLASFHCDVIQGYLISKPLSARDFTAWMQAALAAEAAAVPAGNDEDYGDAPDRLPLPA